MKHLRSATILATILAMFATACGQQSDGVITKADREAAIDRLATEFANRYVFPDVAEKMIDRIRERQRTGRYDSITSGLEFAKALGDDLTDVSNDLHIRVRFYPEGMPAMPAGPTPDQIADTRRSMRIDNYGFQKVERLEGNIGYIELRGFMDALLGGDTVASAMTFLSGCDALIFDLRRNGGGSPEMVALITSYLYSGENDAVHLNSIYWRPDDSTRQYWTLPYVPGKRFADKPVYILTSSRTFSAAEEFTYNLKNLKRATVVGETTGGGAHPGGFVRLTDRFEVFVPMGRAINPITGTNWEGSGVAPDVETPAAEALQKAHELALQKLAEEAKESGDRARFEAALAAIQVK